MKLKKEFKIYFRKAVDFLRNKKNLKILGAGIVLIIIVSGAYFYKYYTSPLKIGFIADIHAGDQSNRSDGEEAINVLIPNSFEKNVSGALQEMKDSDLIIALGDSLNRPSRKNTRKLLEITEDYPMVWVKGNHDKLLHYNELLSKERYRYIDKKGWRIIVLDNSATYPNKSSIDEHGRGLIDEEQLAWLKKSLQTKKNVVIAMHLPMLKRGDFNTIREDYKYLEELLIQSGNVKHIFSGHLHIYDEQIERNGIMHHLVPSISLESKQGFYYKIEL
ncbi:MAG: metallophosphoesterase [Candidatus Moranbacteria bacterium]|jgi:3',5'-cyclic AMP phosphodiesterase CpdA|nr:metallophosphoesterase [Candidatus Moranbacteria bacterium]